jgi:hypothetical protein
MFISQSDISLTNIKKQLQDEQSGQKTVSMEYINNMVIHTSDILMLTKMELDVHLNRGKY